MEFVGDVAGQESGGVGGEKSEEFANFGAQVGADGFFVTAGVERDRAEDVEADWFGLPGLEGKAACVSVGATGSGSGSSSEAGCGWLSPAGACWLGRTRRWGRWP